MAAQDAALSASKGLSPAPDRAANSVPPPDDASRRGGEAFQAGYGHHGSLADLFRQIGHDERVHKLESLAALDEPRLRDDLSAALEARSQRLPADRRQ